MEREELLRKVKALIPAKGTLYLDNDFIKDHNPTIGVGKRKYGALTRNYIFVECYAEPFMEDGLMVVNIKKYPLQYKGNIVKKIPLYELCNNDLNTLLHQLSFYHYWMYKVLKPSLENKINICNESERFVDKGMYYQVIFVHDIIWDTDGKHPIELGLPSSEMIVIRCKNITDKAIDAIYSYLSDKYGYCVESFQFAPSICAITDIDEISQRYKVIDEI